MNPQILSFLTTYGLIIVMVFILIIAVIRWVLRIDRRVNNQTAMVWILIKMAERQGVPAEDIDKIKKAFYIK